MQSSYEAGYTAEGRVLYQEGFSAQDSVRQMTLSRMCTLESLRCAPPAPAVLRKAATDLKIRGYNVPKGTNMLLSVVPNKHVDPLRLPLPASERRCPFDFNGVNRTATGHDGFDFNPFRW